MEYSIKLKIASFITAEKANAIRCYVCIGKDDPGCLDPFVNATIEDGCDQCSKLWVDSPAKGIVKSSMENAILLSL